MKFEEKNPLKFLRNQKRKCFCFLFDKQISTKTIPLKVEKNHEQNKRNRIFLSNFFGWGGVRRVGVGVRKNYRFVLKTISLKV